MNPILTLAGIGVIESVVYLRRYRSAVGGCSRRAANDAALIVLIGLVRLWAGATAVLDRSPLWLLCIAYVLPVWATTYLAHRRIAQRALRTAPATGGGA